MTGEPTAGVRETFEGTGVSALVEDLRIYGGVTRLHAGGFGEAIALRSETERSLGAERGPLHARSVDRTSTLCVFVSTQARAELRHLGRVVKLAPRDVLIVDSDAGFSMEADHGFAQTIMQVPKAVLSRRVEPMRARAGELMCGDDPKVAAMQAALLQLLDPRLPLAPGEQMSAFHAAMHVLDILLARPEPPPGEALYERALAAIERLLAEPTLRPDTLARALRTSRRTLEQAFAQRGLTVARTIWDLRLQRAADMIAEDRRGVHTLTSIAVACGFRSSAHFSRAFSAKYGVTPRQARPLEAR